MSRPPIVEPMPIKELLAARKALGFQHRTGLAAALNISVSSVDQWEKGSRPVPSYQATAIRDLLAAHRQAERDQAARMAGPVMAHIDFMRDAAAARQATQQGLFEMQARSNVPAYLGLASTAGAAGLAGLFCWWADDAPSGTLALLVVGAASLGGIGAALLDVAARSCVRLRLKSRRASMAGASSVCDQNSTGPAAAMQVEPVLG